MSIFKLHDIAALRVRLERRADQLRAEIAAAQPRRIGDDRAQEVADSKDMAADEVAAAVHDAELQRDIDELASVRSALARVDDPAFGTCADCGEPIALARLQQLPWAVRCAACQNAAEKRVR